MSDNKAFQVSAAECAALINHSDNHCILDVREPWEVALAALPGAIHIPLREIHEKMHMLPRDKEVIVYCHHGVRSLRIAQLLRENRYCAHSLKGGINAYALEIDPSIPTY